MSTAPFSFHVDEVISGYIGRFILLNGKDVYGNTFPLFYFDSFGDFRTILPMYINGLSTFLFGVNEFAVRFPTALAGALIVFPVYSLGNIFFKNKKIALLPALLITILPWHIVLSRASSEAAFGLTIFVFGITLFLKSLSIKKLKYLILPSILLATTYFIYPSFRILAPVVLLPLPFMAKNKLKVWYFLIFILFVGLTFLIASTPYGQGRYQQTSLFASKDIANTIKSNNISLSNSEGSNNVFVSRIFHNKIVGYAQEFEKQYFSYFSPNFLFTQGGLPDRYVVPYVGLAYITFVILFLGLLLPVSIKISDKIFYYFLYLLIIAPLPAALTIEDVPNVNRAIFMSVVIVFFATAGLLKLHELIKKINNKLIWPFLIIIVIALSCEFVYFLHQYVVIAPTYRSFQRNDGYKELVFRLRQYSDKKIILPIRDMPIYYLFFNNNFNKNIAGKLHPGLNVENLDNLYFVRNNCPTEEIVLNKQDLDNTLIVEYGDCPIKIEYKQITTVIRKDFTTAYRVLQPLPAAIKSL